MARLAHGGAAGRPAHPLTPFVDRLPIPPRHVITEPTCFTVRVETAQHRFHRELPPSRVWTYDGHLPGPTIEVRRGVPVEVTWENRIEGTLPVTVVRAPAYVADGVPVQCLPGRSGGQPHPSAAALSGFSVVHVHGAVTHAASDGWTENLAAPGQQTVDTYPNDQRAALLWYHDHVMGVTRFSVYAGLAGLWILRDDHERDLDLPEGPPYELPLLLTDRNFDTDPDGSLTGELVHKTDPEVMECFSPFTAVNGAVWPVVEVEPTTYRWRVLNGSNARTYRLVLTRDGELDHGRITQIGTEGELLLAPTPLPAQGLVLASAERADLLVDFSDLAPGAELTLWNTAAAPFDGTFADPATAGRADLDGLLPYPEVLRVRVVDGRRGEIRPTPPVLATDFHPAVVEIDDSSIASGATSATVRVGEAPDDDIPHALDDNERGLKDTVRVNANEVVDIVVRFATFAGRYMYHCHILEHEDHDMMRPFVVMPAELMPFMGMHRR
jgi:FtsP/CotA-like multicopper oxidase with cupredoxin domain